MKMAMLHRENRRMVLYFILCVILFVSCNKYKTYNTKEIANIRDRTLSISLQSIGQDNYWHIYNMANDSIIDWSKNELGLWKYYGNLTDYQLDSVFCINKTGDKIIFSILRRNLHNDAVGDGISYFYGVKIRNTWYFFEGAYMVLQREFYQEDIHTPLSFEKLKQIATSNIYRGYLKKGKNGEWEINDDFFDGISNKNISTSGYGGCIECQTEEEYYMYLVKKNWQKKK